jgi:hypothetical protein
MPHLVAPVRRQVGLVSGGNYRLAKPGATAEQPGSVMSALQHCKRHPGLAISSGFPWRKP